MILKNKINKIFILTTIGMIVLCGCSSVKESFRDREYDYARAKIHINSELKIPKKLHASSETNPEFKLPEGDINYKKEIILKLEGVMIPPNYETKYDITNLKKSKNNESKGQV